MENYARSSSLSYLPKIGHHLWMFSYIATTPPRPSGIREKIFTNYCQIGCASQLVDPNRLPGFSSYFLSMALYQKWDVKNGFAFVLQFFSLISDSLAGVLLKKNVLGGFLSEMYKCA